MTLAERLRGGLRAVADDLLVGDLNGEPPEPLTGWRPAAVLIAVTDRADPGVLLTRRTDTMRNHAGQIAFPGGSVDPDDAGPAEAALREAWEEIALPPAQAEVVATLDRYRTVTGFEVSPVLAVVPAGLPLVPAPAEVEAIFEVPLTFLLDRANHATGSGWHDGRERQFHELIFGEWRIWGATAAMIVNLSRRLAWP
ncbi:CoA pyrophosphatase [Sphingomonas sp. CFBP 13720]|uniref:CoA pyrophosphatase n=1 Tax=Sphingomonas sp. CFBP 13720 TaxID=2775302 RepID=UPI00177EF89A|nr:CoA pyrophosphatase [Sphingomonas sp. CFBP 13720]MBD8677138.1 CoA pyrophosphatase [Sphingomonas sp. CFBP 13720]